MRKEITIAIVAGVLFGLVIAFAVWRTNNAFTESVPSSETAQASLSDNDDAEQNESFSIALLTPEDNHVVLELPLTITGVTRHNAWITVSTEGDDYVAQADNAGEFSLDVDLNAGINKILITAIDGKETTEKQVNVVYSSEFLSSIREEISEN